ncbi:hypothetical protein SELMODRAFT_427593 [Selaginella moellendorffii]|uniref:Uncharacterized protein n=1 Tax=Selaginella moellendorffii TaxID=88036 RepID=D8T038_SELML|nr:hypothetical protein SELMODRAFT_427593 [Selaginella moellendorffii]
MDLRWFRRDGEEGLDVRIPLCNGKLDLLAIARSLGGLDPAELSLWLSPSSRREEVFHPLPLNYRTGLSSLTWDELIKELGCIHFDAIASLPDAKTRQNAAIIQGIKHEKEPAWMAKLSGICRGRIDADSLLCHKFMLVFRYHLDVNDPNVVAIDKEHDHQGLMTQEEEELYINRHLPQAQAHEIVREISQLLPQSSYRWLDPEEIDSKVEVFRAINLDVEVRSKSSAVLAHGSDPVLGIEVFSELSRQGLNRCELEFYLWARSSKLPFLQLVTDFNSAVVFYYRFPRTGSMSCDTMSYATLKKLVKVITSSLPRNSSEFEMAWSILGWKRFGDEDEW